MRLRSAVEIAVPRATDGSFPLQGHGCGKSRPAKRLPFRVLATYAGPRLRFPNGSTTYELTVPPPATKVPRTCRVPWCFPAVTALASGTCTGDEIAFAVLIGEFLLPNRIEGAVEPSTNHCPAGVARNDGLAAIRKRYRPR